MPYLIFIVIAFVYCLPFIFIYEYRGAFKFFPWTPGQPFMVNITGWGIIAMAGVLLWMTHKGFKPFWSFGGISSDYTDSKKGVIREMDFSGARINGKPLLDVTVVYAGNKKVFTSIPSSFHFSFKPGDQVIVRHLPGDLMKADLDVDASIKLKNGEYVDNAEESEGESAFFYVQSVEDKESDDGKECIVTGRVNGGEFDGRQASFSAVVTDVQRVRLNEGKILPVTTQWTSSGLQVNVLSFE